MDAALLEQEGPLLLEELGFLGVRTDRRSARGAGGAAFLATGLLLTGAAGFVFGAAFGAAVFGTAFFGAAFVGAVFFGTAFFASAFFGAVFFGTAFFTWLACLGDGAVFGAAATGFPFATGFLAFATGFLAEAGFLAFAEGFADVLLLAFATGFFTGVTSTSSTDQPVAPPPPDDDGADRPGQ